MSRLKEQSEFKIILRQNKLFLLLACVCVLLIIKHSQAPFPWEYNAVTKLLFLSPQADTAMGSVFEVCYTLGLSYLASLLFYFVVNYFPKRKRERRAFLLIKDRIERIDLFINRLISYLMFFAGLEGDPRKLTPDMLLSLCKIPFDGIGKPCHTTETNLSTGDIEAEGNPICISDIQDLRAISAAILSQTREILSLPYASNIEDDILETLGVLRNCTVLSRFSEMKDSYVSPGMRYICNFSSLDLLEVLTALAYLQRHKYSKHLVITVAADPDSIEDAQVTYQEMLEKYPEQLRAIEMAQKQTSEKDKAVHV